MQNTDLRELFAKTVHPDAEKRRYAEEHLLMYQKQPEFILSLPTTYMKDSDFTIRKVASVYFRNSVIGEWNTPAFLSAKKQLIPNIIGLIRQCDRCAFPVYVEVLRHIIEKEELSEWNIVFTQAVSLLGSDNVSDVLIALITYQEILKAERMKYVNSDTLTFIFDNSGKLFLERFQFFLEQQNYALSKMFMKIIAQACDYYAIPRFFVSLEVYAFVYNISKRIIETKEVKNNDFYGMKKWASYFLYKATVKAIKKFYKDSHVIDYVLEQQRFTSLYNTFKTIIFTCSGKENEKILKNATEYLVLLVGESERYWAMIRPDIYALVSNFIFPLQVYNDDLEDDPKDYLRRKYNYYSNDLNTSAVNLFIQIVKRVRREQNTFDEIYKYLICIFDNYMADPNPVNASNKYAALNLFANISQYLTNLKGAELGTIISKYVFTDLNSKYLFLRSQACFTLQFFEGDIIKDNSIITALDMIMNLLKSDNEALQVDAALSSSFFFSNMLVDQKFRRIIPELLHALITLSTTNDLEALSDVLESIIRSYPEEVSVFAPKLVSGLSTLSMAHLNNDNGDKIMLISGYFRTICGLVISMHNKKELLSEMYKYSYELILYILSHKKSDFYPETLDLMVNFLWGLKVVDQSMWKILEMVLAINKDELCNVREEFANLIDNYISYGRENFLVGNFLVSLDTQLVGLCMLDDGYFFSDDHSCACRIIESLLLNLGSILLQRDPARIEYYIDMVLKNYDHFEEDSFSIIFAWEIVMNCFINNPLETLAVLKRKNLIAMMITDIYKNRERFNRVHDKKLCLFFIGELLKLREDIIPELNMSELISFFYAVLSTLPKAIEKRKKLQNEELSEEEEEEYEEDDEYNSSDYLPEELEEDICFETPLDNFDVFMYLGGVLSQMQSGTVGYKLWSNMTPEQQNGVNKVITTNKMK
ncbi:putative importin [Astathelohania contejeani]|uniref:Importin n=1 Tax=Astathelohania contejeani TaxID=164912 RepID=A0ABQ7I1T4_9MICR|nr:putative importin [Thelohania contejeani]